MNNEVKILGFTQEVTVCDRCGKTELKGTYAIEVNGETLYLGSTCISHRFEMTEKEAKQFISSEKKRFLAEKRARLNELYKAKDEATKGLDFWEDYEAFKKAEKPFNEEIGLLIRTTFEGVIPLQ